jgi:2-haloacid dehalogenase
LDTTAPDTLLFDIGNVLIDWNPRHLYGQLFAEDSAAMEQFLANVCTPEWNRQMDAGKPFAEAVTELQREHPEHAELIEAWHLRWPEMLGGAIEASVALLEELRRRGHRLYALTNWSAETFPLAREQFEFLQHFEEIVVSGEVRLLKPDPRIFELATARCDLDPARTVFIDDSPANVSAAQAQGFVAVQYVDSARLRTSFAELGVL